jgi:hypothetical protein
MPKVAKKTSKVKAPITRRKPIQPTWRSVLRRWVIESGWTNAYLHRIAFFKSEDEVARIRKGTFRGDLEPYFLINLATLFGKNSTELKLKF